jgi:hypothetical protein
MTGELERMKVELDQAKEINRLKDQQISKLNSKVQKTQNQLEILQRKRPKLSPEKLVDAFRLSLEKMQEGLVISESRTRYIVNKFEVELKTAITLDDDGKINFQLLNVDDIIPNENLSQVHMAFLPVVKPATPPEGAREVPGIIGLHKDKAIERLISNGFKIGEIREQLSNSPVETVIAQDPERYTHASAGIDVDFVISKPRETKVPNLIGLSKDDAFEILSSNRLLQGKVTEQISDSKSGTILSQSIKEGTIVAVDTHIDLVLSSSRIINMPDLKGMTQKEAEQMLKKLGLQVGRVFHRRSPKTEGTVIGQKPNPGKKVERDTGVNFTIATSE